MGKYLDKILRRLNPTPIIAGLELSDFYIRFFCGEGGKMLYFDARLNPGIIKEGRVINSEKFREAIDRIKLKLGNKFKKISHLIVTLPSSGVYLQTFSLPYLTGEKLNEAARLNLQMLTPMPAEETYADWDLLEEDNNGELKILGAFTEKSNVDNIVKICREAGFVILAIEPSIQAIERSVSQFLIKEKNPAPYLILNVSSEGMDFVGVKNHKIYFQYFISWFSMYSGASEIAPTVFEDTVNRYVQQVVNFAMSHWNFELKNVVLTASELKDQISKIIEKNFNLKVAAADFGTLLPGIVWGSSSGAYLRGLLPRSEDKLISLTGVGTEEEFRQSQLLLFSESWRNIIVTSSVTLLLIFFSSHLLLGNIAKNALAQNVEGLRSEELAELSILKEKANIFNNLIYAVRETKKSRRVLYPYFEALQRALGGDIYLTRAAFQSFSAPVVISGLAANENALTNFKHRLETSKEFSNVILPLNSIMPSGGGKISFAISLNFVSL